MKGKHRVTAGATERVQLVLVAAFFFVFSSAAFGQLAGGTTDPSASAKLLMSDVSIATEGAAFTAVVKTDGTLWVTGQNSNGQLGLGPLGAQTIFRQLDSDVVKVAASWDDLYYIKANHTLWGCGSNKYGQLGGTYSANVTKPRKLFDHAQSVAAGAGFVLILDTNGDLWAMGHNDSGQLGDGTKQNVAKPILILHGVAQVAAGQYFSVVLKTDGDVWFCGSNTGQLMSEDSGRDFTEFVKICSGAAKVFANYDSNSLYVLSHDHTLYCRGDDLEQFFGATSTTSFLPVMRNVIDFSPGEEQILAVKTDNSVWGACGKYNNYGLLGDGVTFESEKLKKVMDGVAKVWSGIYDSLFLKQNGQLWGSGYNGSGGLM